MSLDVYIPMVAEGSVYQAPYTATPVQGVQSRPVNRQQAEQLFTALDWTPETKMAYFNAQDAAMMSEFQREDANRQVDKANWRLNLQTAARLQDEEMRLQAERQHPVNPDPRLIPTYENKMPEWSYRARGSGLSEEDKEGYKSTIARRRSTPPPPPR